MHLSVKYYKTHCKTKINKLSCKKSDQKGAIFNVTDLNALDDKIL